MKTRLIELIEKIFTCAMYDQNVTVKIHIHDFVDTLESYIVQEVKKRIDNEKAR